MSVMTPPEANKSFRPQGVEAGLHPHLPGFEGTRAAPPRTRRHARARGVLSDGATRERGQKKAFDESRRRRTFGDPRAKRLLDAPDNAPGNE